MDLQLKSSSKEVTGEILITGSKSESNRLLILQALYPGIRIENLSNSDDSQVLSKALDAGGRTIDIHHAGTAMRFLTAYFACRQGREVLLTGSSRMQQRPVSLLVDALRDLGADIEYEQKEGYPPLIIKGKELTGDKVRLKANVSSQYISALMLIAPSLPNGLEIFLEGKVTSTPYIRMTLSLLREAGFEGSFKEKRIKIPPRKVIPEITVPVESDWSSASYFYSIAALSAKARIELACFKENSHQGDRVIAEIFEQFGVHTAFSGEKMILTKANSKKPRSLMFHLADSPDLAQTIAVTCIGLGIPCKMIGLHTLKIKETDRLMALKNEIEKLGGRAEITSDSIKIFPVEELKSDQRIATYDDHRMAMAFAPLALKIPVIIEEAGVVSKSYPAFWEDLIKLGIGQV